MNENYLYFKDDQVVLNSVNTTIFLVEGKVGQYIRSYAELAIIGGKLFMETSNIDDVNVYGELRLCRSTIRHGFINGSAVAVQSSITGVTITGKVSAVQSTFSNCTLKNADSRYDHCMFTNCQITGGKLNNCEFDDSCKLTDCVIDMEAV